MHSLKQLLILALAASGHAFPALRLWRWSKRQSTTPTLSQMNDVDILRYALTLEHLEDKFYREVSLLLRADLLVTGCLTTMVCRV